VIILGRRIGQPAGRFILISVDFSDIYERKCELSDYENWTPPFKTTDIKATDLKGCVLGHTVTYKRRKTTSQCENGGDYDKVSSVVYCNCSHTDYECDYGFERTSISKRCVLDAGTTYHQLRDIECANSPDGTYVYSGGYRKIPGDKCINEDLTYASITRECHHHFRTWAIIVSVLLVLLVVIGSALGYFVYSIRKGKVPTFLTQFPFVMEYVPVKTTAEDEVEDLLSNEFDHEESQ